MMSVDLQHHLRLSLTSVRWLLFAIRREKQLWINEVLSVTHSEQRTESQPDGSFILDLAPSWSLPLSYQHLHWNSSLMVAA
jgi:hypothetical protein